MLAKPVWPYNEVLSKIFGNICSNEQIAQKALWLAARFLLGVVLLKLTVAKIRHQHVLHQVLSMHGFWFTASQACKLWLLAIANLRFQFPYLVAYLKLKCVCCVFTIQCRIVQQLVSIAWHFLLGHSLYTKFHNLLLCLDLARQVRYGN